MRRHTSQPRWIFKQRLKKTVIYVFPVLSVFALGLFFGLNSWDKNLYVQWSPMIKRGLAGLEGDEENILNLSSDQLVRDPASILVADSKVVESEEGDHLAFYLGNFLAPPPTHSRLQMAAQERAFICQLYDFVEFSFVATGLRLSGGYGSMILRSPCNMEDELNIGPFWIPREEILSSDTETVFELPEEDTFVRFYNASIVLTPEWLLETVRFFNEAQVEEEEEQELLIHLDPEEHPFSISLQPENSGEDVVPVPL